MKATIQQQQVWSKQRSNYILYFFFPEQMGLFFFFWLTQIILQKNSDTLPIYIFLKKRGFAPHQKQKKMYWKKKKVNGAEPQVFEHLLQ